MNKEIEHTAQKMWLEWLLLCHLASFARREYCLEEDIRPGCYRPLVFDVQNDTSMLLKYASLLKNEFFKIFEDELYNTSRNS
jgi:hypothetical protein